MFKQATILSLIKYWFVASQHTMDHFHIPDLILQFYAFEYNIVQNLNIVTTFEFAMKLSYDFLQGSNIYRFLENLIQYS
jgi:hypothetical protein